MSSEDAGGPLDEATIREFLAGDYPRLVAGVAMVTGSLPAAEDAVQEALARAWERSERGERIESLPAWVMRVAMNLSRSRFRRMRAEARARERIAAAVRPATDVAADVDVRRALAGLPRRQREATVLRYYLGMDVAEIAATLGVAEGTVKVSLHRARQALAKVLGERELEEANESGV
jgi:RNA polymerase sigma-70 factor (ECF subfamily)